VKSPGNINQLQIAQVRGRSRLVGCRTVPPLKILNPRCSSSACHVLASNYGGGLVGNDHIQLDIDCGPESTFFFGTQANTRVYNSGQGAGSRQHTRGRVASGALAVVGVDPLVLHAGSRFKQSQTWDVAAGGALGLVDWIVAGRLDIGEEFAFKRYESTIRLHYDGRTILLDPLRLAPGDRQMRSPAVMGRFNHLLSIYLVGCRIRDLGRELFSAGTDSGSDLLTAATEIDELYVLRAVSGSRGPLQQLLQRLYRRLSELQWLGFDPMARKY